MISDLSGNVEHYQETLAYGEMVTDPLMNGEENWTPDFIRVVNRHQGFLFR